MGVQITRTMSLPGLALAIVAGAALASGASVETIPAYGPQTQRLDAAAAGVHAGANFSRADLDADGALDLAEYEALTIVLAELARINGFIAIDYEHGVRTVALPVDAPRALTGAERIRVGALAAREFHVIAGADSRVSRDEFIAARLEAFDAADFNRNGALTGRELQTYAAWAAHFSAPGA